MVGVLFFFTGPPKETKNAPEGGSYIVLREVCLCSGGEGVCRDRSLSSEEEDNGGRPE